MGSRSGARATRRPRLQSRGDRSPAGSQARTRAARRRRARARSRSRSTTPSRLSSSAASSSSSRTSELARSETLLTVAPRPGLSCSVSGVCMAPPVDDLGEHDPGDERRADDRAAGRGPCRPCASSSSAASAASGPPGPARRFGARLLVRRRVALRASLDQARLQLPQERRVVAQLLREPLADAVASRRGAVGEVLQLVGAALDEEVALVDFFTGAPRPSARRQSWDAARRAAIVATAAMPRRDRSRAACEALPDRCLTATRPTWALL